MSSQNIFFLNLRQHGQTMSGYDNKGPCTKIVEIITLIGSITGERVEH